ncbi:PD40 domain-containing protein, partial [bacterium]|nr:PD40 domain-containing protein [bacterium]
IQEATYKAGGVGLGTWSTQAEYKDVSVTTLDGRKLYGASKMELADAALDALGASGADLRKEFDGLRTAGAKPDDPRWNALYQRVAKRRDLVRDAKAQLAALDFPAARTALQELVERWPDARDRAQALLGQLAGHEKQAADLEAALVKGAPLDARAIEAAQSCLQQVTDLRRSMYIPRCPPIAFLKRQAFGRHGTNGTMHARVHGVGSAICLLDPRKPDAGPKTIFDDPQGFIFDMSPSYDATRLVFAYKKDVPKRQDSFHIYEINVDGTGLRQLTQGRFHDFSPAYLPDGRIVFNSTRVESFSLCQDFLAAALYVIDGDGSNLRRLEYNTLCDQTPFVMDDGSVLFSRWEYQDKNIFCTQALWTINPDGTRLQLFYGNTLTIPNSIYGAKQFPGTKKLVCVMAAHHHPPYGAVAIIDRSLGHENVAGIRNITPEVPYTPTVGKHWRETSWGPGDKLYRWSYTDPHPVASDLMVVSYGGPMKGGPQRYRLFLMDLEGTKVPLYDDPKTSCFNAVPLQPRPAPHRISGELPEKAAGEGRFFVFDIYQGLLDAGVQRGQVKAIRVMSQLPKKYNTEGPRYSDHYPAIGEGTYYVKHNYGTVPVDANGSAYFAAPAGVELYFQALDARGKEIRRMGTITQITDGETQSCIGCHEDRSSTPSMSHPGWARLKGPPDRIKAPAWGAGPVDFVTQVQPVLDKHCVKCHSGAAPPKGVDLSGDKTRLFNMAFETLVFRPGLVARYHINPGPTGNFPALGSGSWVSGLTKRIESKHSKVDMDDDGRRRIYTWIDANVPYYHTYLYTDGSVNGARDRWYDDR